MLGPVLDVVPPLNKMQPACCADIGSDKDASLAVEIQSPRISAAFRKQFESFGRGVIAPDSLSQEIDSFDMTGRGAALNTVKPPVWTPVQTVCYRMSVFDAKAGKMNLGITIRHIISIAVGIKQQVGWVQHPNPVTTHRDAGGNIQASQKILVQVEKAIPIRIFQNCNLISATDVIRGRQWNLIKDGSQIFVVFHDLQTRREWILDVLHHP